MRREIFDRARRDGVKVRPNDLVRVGDGLYPVVGLVLTSDGWEVEIDLPREARGANRWVPAARLVERDAVGAWLVSEPVGVSA